MLWDLNEGKHLYSLEAGDIVNALVFSPNRYWLCAATASCVKIFDLESKWVNSSEFPFFNIRHVTDHFLDPSSMNSSLLTLMCVRKQDNLNVFPLPGRLMDKPCSVASPTMSSASGPLHHKIFYLDLRVESCTLRHVHVLPREKTERNLPKETAIWLSLQDYGFC